MKIYNVIICIALLVLLIGNVSAAEWDNVKSYDPNTRTITVTNLLGLGSDIATLQLITPLHNRVAPGYNKVAEIKINFLTDYTDSYQEMKFYNSEMQQISRTFDFKFKDVRYEKVDDFELQCKPKTLGNGTIIDECKSVNVGSHMEYKTYWVPFDKLKNKEQILAGEYTIGIFTNVIKTDKNIEWVPKFFGVTIDEWASWTAALDVDLKAYYKLDGTTGDVKDELDQHNGTNNGATRGATGIIATAFDFESGDGTDRVLIPASSDFNMGNFTMSLWFKPESNAQGYILRADSGSEVLYLAYLSTNKINYYLDATNFDSSSTFSAGNWYNVVITRQDNGTMTMYVNNNSEGTATNTGTLGSVRISLGNDWGGAGPVDGIIDEVAIWGRVLNRTEIDDLYNNGNGITYATTNAAPWVNAISPANNSLYTTSPKDINFTCYGADDVNFTQMEFYLNGTLTNTNSSGLNNTNYTFEVTGLNSGDYNWSCTGYDNDTLSTSTGTLFFIIDTAPPDITVNTPASSYDSLVDGQDITLNISIEDSSNLDTIYYNYNGTQIDVTHGGSTSWEINDTITYIGGNNNITIFANDTLGNSNTYVFNWTVKVIDYGGYYNNETTEGALEYFNNTIRLGSGLSLSDFDLVYNGSLEGGSSATSGSDIILSKSSLLVPDVTTTTNITFYWSLTLSDASIINLTSYNQTVYNLTLDDCSTNTVELYNFTMVDEEEQTPLSNTTLEVAVNIYDGSRSSVILNLSDSYSANPTRICINRNVTEGSLYLLDAVLKYSSTDPDHATEYYNIVNSSLTSETTTNKITLYDLNLTDSTEFQLTFTGDDYLPVEGALIYVDRQYISENQFKTVELPKTDSNGQTILHLVRNDVIYNIRVIKDGSVLGTFNNIVAFCEDYTIGDCKINLNSADTNPDIFNYDSELGLIFTTPTYNETTQEVTFSFTTDDGTSKYVSMNVTRDNVIGNRSVCNSSITSSSSTLTCSLSSVDDSVLRVNIYVDGDLILTTTFELSGTNYGEAGYLVYFVMALGFILMFSRSKSGVLFGIIISFIAGVGLGILNSSLIGLGAAGLWLILIVIIGLYKLNKDRPQ